jgi:preprotein translocase subunit YajC
MPTALFLALVTFLADTAAPADSPGDSGGATAPNSGGTFQMLIMFGLIFGVMYLFVVKPQRSKENEEKQMLEKLKKNDHVVTKGGMHGVVMNVKDDTVTLKIDEQQNVKVTFQKNAIATILGEDEKSATEEKKA